MAVVLMATLALALVIPSAEQSEGAQFGIEGDQTLFGTGDSLDDAGIYVVTDGNVYSASVKIIDNDGKSVGSVSPSSITNSMFNTDPKQQIKGTVPSTSGDYRLSVEFRMTSDSNSERFTRTYPLKVVDPIILKITVKNTSTVNVMGLDFQFVIDGNAMEVTNKDVEIAADTTSTVEYRWIVDNPSGGRHTYSVTVFGEDHIGRINTDDLDKEFTFYIGQDNYGWLTAVLIILLIILVIFMIWVLRKPVKNYGKPKGRR